jgi:hypothetical protein
MENDELEDDELDRLRAALANKIDRRTPGAWTLVRRLFLGVLRVVFGRRRRS